MSMPPSVEAEAVPPSTACDGERKDELSHSLNGPNDDVMTALGVTLSGVNLSQLSESGRNPFSSKGMIGTNNVSFSSGTSGDGSRNESPTSFNNGINHMIPNNLTLDKHNASYNSDGLPPPSIPFSTRGPSFNQFHEPGNISSLRNREGIDVLLSHSSSHVLGEDLLSNHLTNIDSSKTPNINTMNNMYRVAPGPYPTPQSVNSQIDKQNHLINHDLRVRPSQTINMYTNNENNHERAVSNMSQGTRHRPNHTTNPEWNAPRMTNGGHEGRFGNGVNGVKHSANIGHHLPNNKHNQNQLWMGHPDRPKGNEFSQQNGVLHSKGPSNGGSNNNLQNRHSGSIQRNGHGARMQGHIPPSHISREVGNTNSPPQHHQQIFHPNVPHYEPQNIQIPAPRNQENGVHSHGLRTDPVHNTRNYHGNPDGNNMSHVHQQQVFYMAVPMQNGQGQVLQPVQVVQLPHGQSTLVVPSPNHPHRVISNGMDNNGGQPHNRSNNHSQQNRNANDTRGDHTGDTSNRGNPFQSMANAHAHHFENNKKQNKRNKAKVNGNTKYEEKINVNAQDSHFIPNDQTLLNDYHNNQASNQDNGNRESNESDQFQNGANVVPSEAITALYHSAHRPPLSSLLGHVRRLSRDQVGCRLLQQSLDEDGPRAATAILHEGLPFIAETMTDPFGNYLFQKILEKISADERLLLIKTVSPRLVNAALNLHGTRSVQKVVEMSISDDASPVEQNAAAEAVTNSLAPAAARLCIDSHGNHVIQRILQRLPHRHSKFVFDAVANSVGDVARHRHGCCVIQRCLDSPSSPARSNLVRRIVEKALDLMQDAYGNYVVQYVLDVCGDEEAAAVCESVIGKVGLLAIQKFSSNVMEKCLERSSDWVQELYLRELSVPDKIRELMTDPFGNYVVQRALSVATHAQAVRLVEAMRPHLPGIRNTAGGRRIVAKICRRFPNFNLNMVPSGNNFVTEQQLQQMQPFPQQHMNYHQHHMGSSVSMGFVNGSNSASVTKVMHVDTDPRKGMGIGNGNGYYGPH